MRALIRQSRLRRSLLEARASIMRRAPTRAEELLFRALSGGKLGIVFRRQVVLIDRYIADICAPGARLVVEVDGPYHAKRRRADERRDRVLRCAGYSVVRLEASVVERELAVAIERVREALLWQSLG